MQSMFETRPAANGKQIKIEPQRIVCLECGEDFDACKCASDSAHTWSKINPGDDLKGG